MVRALWNVFQYCKQTGRHEFTRKELDPLLEKGTQYANFGYWKWWSAGLVYTPTIDGKTGRGYWGFNVERIDQFFAGQYKVWSQVWVKGKGKTRDYKTEAPVTIDEIEGISKFIYDDEYVVQYRKPVQQTMI